jgi:predicted nucleic acid-binding protein
MTVAVFVDTNVLVYARDASESSKQARAAEWLRELWLEQRGRTSVQVLSEYYTAVTRKLRPGLPPDEAWDDVSALFAWQPQQIDRHLLEKAREIERRHALSWWDAMIVAAAQIQNCEVLLSEDLQHGWTCGTLTVRNPFAERIGETAPPYTTFAAPLSRHRPRGRPRKQASVARAAD